MVAESKAFKRICDHLREAYFEVTRFHNTNAEKPHHQARYSVVRNRQSIYLDVIESVSNTKPVTTVVIHNQEWKANVSEENIKLFSNYLNQCDTPFVITQGMRHD